MINNNAREKVSGTFIFLIFKKYPAKFPNTKIRPTVYLFSPLKIFSRSSFIII